VPAAQTNDLSSCNQEVQNKTFYHQPKEDYPMKQAGLWKLTGKQNMFPNLIWEADLVLQPDGKMTWTETKGANVGASRNGNWTLTSGGLYFQYQAPRVGKVTWSGALDAAGTRVNAGTYRAGSGNAYGGTWSGRKL